MRPCSPSPAEIPATATAGDDSRDLFRTLFEHGSAAYVICHAAGEIIAVNSAACTALARQASDLVGRSLQACLPDLPLPLQPVRSAGPQRACGSDGRNWPLTVEISALPTGAFALHLFPPPASAAPEFTARHDETVLRAAFETMTDGLLIVSAQGRIAYYNRRFLEIWSISADLAAHSDDSALIAFVSAQVADEQEFAARITAIYRSGERTEDLLQLKDRRVLERISFPLPRSESSAPERVWMFRDVTARAQAEATAERRLAALTRPPGDTRPVGFEELFDLAEIQELQDRFAAATGVASIITRPDGTPITRPSSFCRLCRDIIRETPLGRANCQCSDAMLGRHHPDGPVVQACLSGGLWDAGASITVGGQHVANWLIGQVRDGTQSDHHMAAYARKIGADETAFLTAFREVPTMPRAQFERVAQALFVLAAQLSKPAYQNLQQARSIVERDQAESALRASQTLLAESQRIARLGSWQLDVATEQLVWSDECYRICGVDPRIFQPTLTTFRACVHPQDRALTDAHFQTSLATLAFEPFECRIVRPDGQTAWIGLTGGIICAPAGRPVRMFGTQQDITERKRAEQALRDSEQRFRQMFEHSRAIMLLIDPDVGAIVEANPAAAEFYGYSPATLRQMRIDEINALPPDRMKEERLAAAAGRRDFFVFPHRLASGEIRTVEVRSSPIGVDDRHLLFSIVQDVTERHRAEAAAQRSTRQLRMLGECNEAVARAADEDELFQTACRTVVETGGYLLAWVGLPENDEARSVRVVASAGLDESYARNLAVSWASDERGESPAGTAIRTGLPCALQNVMAAPRTAAWQPVAAAHGIASICALPLTADTHILGTLCIDSAQPDAFDPAETALLQRLADTLAHGLAALRTRAERARTELALREAESLYRKIFETSPDGMTLVDLEGRITFASPRALEMFGVPHLAAAQGRPIFDFIAPEDRDRARAGIANTIDHPVGPPLHYTLCRADGSCFAGDVNSALLRDAAGQPKNILTITRDATARKAAETALRRTQVSIDHAREPIFWIRRDGTLLYVNDAGCRSLGYTREEMAHLSIADLDPQFPRERWTEHWEQSRRRPYHLIETLHRTKDGRTFPVEVAINVLEFEGQEFHCAYVRDIGERRRVEEALRASDRKLAEIFRSSPEMIVVTAVEDGRLIEINDAGVRMLGFTRDEMLGHTTLELNIWPTAAERDRILGLVRSTGQVQNTEVCFRKKSGGLVEVLMSMAPLRVDNRACLITIATDITDRKRAEEARLTLERQLLHTQKLESLGVLAGGIAHDFNNLLTAILGNLDMALIDLSPYSPVRTSIEQSVQAARRAADLTRQMLAYSGKGSFVIQEISLSDLVVENAHLFRASISKLVNLRVETAADLPLIKADSAQIQQVVMNLITNASEAVDNRPGVVCLHTRLQDYTEEELRSSRSEPPPPPGRFVVLEVTDTGCGMDEPTQRRLFDPFFTTKFAGRGLGMSAILGIVRAHQGAIFVESALERGTTIRVLLPALPPASPARLAAPRSANPLDANRPSRGTILIVDDEDIVRQVCKQMLARRGWRVLEAADGLEGIALFREHQAAITCVILDLSMPNLSGTEVFRALRQLQPDLRVLLSSGYSSDHSTSAQLVAEGLAGFMQKPFTAQTLFHELERALRRP